jgi:hypothetical protein
MPAPEESAPFDDLPVGKWFVAETSVDDGSGPEIRAFDGKDGEVRKFNIGLRLKGAEQAILDAGVKVKDRFLFFNSFVEPGEKELAAQETKILSGRLVGFLNATLSMGVGDEFMPEKGKASKEQLAQRTSARWASTVAKLREAAEANGTSPDDYDGSLSRFLAAAGCLALSTQPRVILVKSNQRTNKETKEKYQVEAGQFEDATGANLEKRKVAFVDAEDVPSEAPSF